MSSRLLDHTADLRTFVQAAEAGSFSAVARLAGSTPSAVSKSIDRLERALGVKLLRRSTRGLSLTAEGQAFVQRIAPLLQGIEESIDAVRPVDVVRGRLRCSMPGELGRLLLGPVTTRFMARHAELELELALTDRHVDVIREGYDVVFRVGATALSNLRSRTLARLDMALVASPQLLHQMGEPRSVEALERLPFARYVLGGRPQPVRFADGTTIAPKGRIDLDSGLGLRIAALNGMGVAYLMKCTVQEDLDRGSLVQVLPDLPLPALPLQALHAYDRQLPPRVSLFVDFVAQEIGSRL